MQTGYSNQNAFFKFEILMVKRVIENYKQKQMIIMFIKTHIDSILGNLNWSPV